MLLEELTLAVSKSEILLAAACKNFVATSCNVDSICVNASCVNVRLPGLVSPPSWLLAVSRLLERGIVGHGGYCELERREKSKHARKSEATRQIASCSSLPSYWREWWRDPERSRHRPRPRTPR
ncbi:hypothetical protein ACJJTC_004369 [Scirpophaga incertulas]